MNSATHNNHNTIPMKLSPRSAVGNTDLVMNPSPKTKHKIDILDTTPTLSVLELNHVASHLLSLHALMTPNVVSKSMKTQSHAYSSGLML